MHPAEHAFREMIARDVAGNTWLIQYIRSGGHIVTGGIDVTEARLRDARCRLADATSILATRS